MRFNRIYLGRPWCEAIVLDDGRRLIARPMRSTDGPTLRRSFDRLTPDEIRMRFMHPIKELTPAYADKLARIDRTQEFALVLVENLPPEQALIGAVVRAAIETDTRRAEFAIIVGSEIAGFGLGRYLMGRVIEWSRKKRLHEIYGRVLSNNQPMLTLAQRLGFKRRLSEEDDDVVEVFLPLNRRAESAPGPSG
ncbi:MAG: N-acetyltransferase [Wenzhouxiangella sp.]|nr:MAG: N-acetyltransferase [Wenzhouxiangella sp.]